MTNILIVVVLVAAGFAAGVILSQRVRDKLTQIRDIF